MAGKAKPSQFETFEAGTYNVTGLSFFSKDSTGNPIFKAVGSGWLVAQYRTFVGEKEGPPGSVSPADLALFAATFGCDVSSLPTDRTAALIAVEEMIAAQTNLSVAVYVGKKGWISNIPDMNLPVGEYLFLRDRIATRRDKKPVWYEGNWGEYVKVGLEVVCMGNGAPTPFKGTTACQVWVMRKPITVMRAMFPTATEAILGTLEGELAYYDAGLIEENARTYVRGAVVLKEGNTRPTLDPNTLVAVEKDAVVDYVAPTTPAPATTFDYIPSVLVLREAITYGLAKRAQAGSAPLSAFTPNGKLTRDGQMFCKETLKPIAGRMSLTTSFKDMDVDTVEIYLAEMGATYAHFLPKVRPNAAPAASDDDFGGDDEDTSWD